MFSRNFTHKRLSPSLIFFKEKIISWKKIEFRHLDPFSFEIFWPWYAYLVECPTRIKNSWSVSKNRFCWCNFWFRRRKYNDRKWDGKFNRKCTIFTSASSISLNLRNIKTNSSKWTSSTKPSAKPSALKSEIFQSMYYFTYLQGHLSQTGWN